MPHAYIVDRRQGEFPWFTWVVSVFVLLLMAAALYYLLFSSQFGSSRVIPAGSVEKRIPVTQVTSNWTNDNSEELKQGQIKTSWRV